MHSYRAYSYLHDLNYGGCTKTRGPIFGIYKALSFKDITSRVAIGD